MERFGREIAEGDSGNKMLMKAGERCVCVGGGECVCVRVRRWPHIVKGAGKIIEKV